MSRVGFGFRFTRGVSQACDSRYEPLYRRLGLPRATFSVLVFLTGGPRCGATESVIRVEGVGTGLISMGISGLIGRNCLREGPIRGSEEGARLIYAGGTKAIVREKEHVRRRFATGLFTKMSRRRGGRLAVIVRRLRGGVSRVVEEGSRG